jgi:hypothetical protein
MNATFDDSLRRRNLRTVLGLAAIFFVPLALSFILYYGTSWRPAGSSNHGELIDPARPLPAVALAPVAATPPDAKPFAADKWMLVYVGDGRCDEACRRALFVMRQTRVLLNNEMPRVGRTFLVTGNCCDREFLEREHKGLDAFDATSPAAAELLAKFPAEDRATSLFVVDPLGNLMMRFDARQDPKGLLDDLKKLLKLSHIG